MAGERRRVMGELAAWHVATVLTSLGATGLDPTQLNPYRGRVAPSAAAARLERWKKKRRFRAWVDAFRPR